MLLAGAIFPDHCFGYLATEGIRDWLECNAGRRTGSDIWRCACGRYSGGVEYRLERDGDLYCRNYYQPAA